MLVAQGAWTLTRFRSAVAPLGVKVLSLADVGQPEPAAEGRAPRDAAILGASAIATRTERPTVAFARAFTIDPLFSRNPIPEFNPKRDYPTWSWPISARERAPDFEAVAAADRALQEGGYTGPDNRGAYFHTLLAIAAPNGGAHIIEDVCAGQFRFDQSATAEDGLDFTHCLIPAGGVETLDRLESASRAALSDFDKALRALGAWLAAPA